MSPISRYRSPPWISLLDALEVPAARSRASTSPTRSPRVAASSAAPAPVMPPPMTRTSRSPEVSASMARCRAAGSSAPLMAAGSQLLLGKQASSNRRGGLECLRRLGPDPYPAAVEVRLSRRPVEQRPQRRVQVAVPPVQRVVDLAQLRVRLDRLAARTGHRLP